MTATIPVTSIEKGRTKVKARTGDPTGTLPEFSFTAAETPGTYYDGEWKAGQTWAEDTQLVAFSPTIGATGATVVLTAGTYYVWVRVTVASEVVVRNAGVVTLR